MTALLQDLLFSSTSARHVNVASVAHKFAHQEKNQQIEFEDIKSSDAR